MGVGLVDVEKAFYVVNPSEKAQHTVVEGLNAEAHAVDAKIRQLADVLAAHAVRIRLYCNFRIGGNVKTRLEAFHDGADLAGPQQRRRTASEINSISLLPAGKQADFAAYGVDVGVDIRFDAAVRRKVAVPAFFDAKRDVHVQADHLSSTCRTAMKAS